MKTPGLAGSWKTSKKQHLESWVNYLGVRFRRLDLLWLVDTALPTGPQCFEKTIDIFRMDLDGDMKSHLGWLDGLRHGFYSKEMLVALEVEFVLYGLVFPEAVVCPLYYLS